MKQKITFNRFLELEKELEIRVGSILDVEYVPKSSKLLKLKVQFNGETRTVVTNIRPLLEKMSIIENKEYVCVNILKDSKMLFVTNLEPTIIMGIESTAVILPGELEKGYSHLIKIKKSVMEAKVL